MTCHVLISGTVQGVGFRAFVRSRALKLDLKGWVRNTPDGKVEALFVGSKEKIDWILKHCRKGPYLAQVKNLEVRPKDIREEDHKLFEILR